MRDITNLKGLSLKALVIRRNEYEEYCHEGYNFHKLLKKVKRYILKLGGRNKRKYYKVENYEKESEIKNPAYIKVGNRYRVNIKWLKEIFGNRYNWKCKKDIERAKANVRKTCQRYNKYV